MRRSISSLAAGALGEAQAEAARNTVLILDGPSFSYFDAEDPVQCAQLLEIGRMCRSVIGKSQLLFRLSYIATTLDCLTCTNGITKNNKTVRH